MHGYKKQLDVYREESRTDAAMFMIIDVGGMGQKLKEIQAIRAQTLQNGGSPSDVIVVDAKPGASASKI